MPTAIARHPWLMLGGIVLCVSVAAAYVAWTQPMYSGVAMLRVQQDDPQVTAGLEPVRGADETQSFLNAELVVLVSGPVLDIAMRDPRVADSGLPPQADAVATLGKRLKPRLGRKDGIITLQYEAASPSVAERVVAAVVDAYIAYETRRRAEIAQRLLDVLLNEASEREAQAAKLSRRMFELLESVGTTSFDEKRAADELLSLSMSVRTARAERETADAYAEEAIGAVAADPLLMARYESLRDASPAAGGVELEGSQLRIAITGLELQLQELIATRALGPKHPNVRAAQQQLAGLRVLYAASAHGRLSRAVLREQELDEALRAHRTRTRQLADYATQYAAMNAMIMRQDRELDLLGARIVELKARRDSAGRHVTVVEPAHASSVPTSPQTLRVFAAALCAGVLLGSIAASIRHVRLQRYAAVRPARTPHSLDDADFPAPPGRPTSDGWIDARRRTPANGSPEPVQRLLKAVESGESP